eukprot:CAMPEP_0197588430 /NCGR_PEP_ID=MMETSP1326-20131121/9717_1 /TAXON_ID=1155430 /ORGANISM="Genus nov. species nov., Strain RCC2288" /LENGTH=60 /DNA_ID=CAMNT_0043153257 /DNA_START=48 /DNA_END=227 /DNA_ORIENTATION=+
MSLPKVEPNTKMPDAESDTWMFARSDGAGWESAGAYVARKLKGTGRYTDMRVVTSSGRRV